MWHESNLQFRILGLEMQDSSNFKIPLPNHSGLAKYVNALSEEGGCDIKER
jgi:hypothetical protein